RQGAAGGGGGLAGGDTGGVQAASPLYHHDVVRVHPGRGAAGAGGGGGGGDAADVGDGGVRRHDRRDAVRHLPDAGVLLRHPVGQGPAPRRREARRGGQRLTSLVSSTRQRGSACTLCRVGLTIKDCSRRGIVEVQP